MQDDDVKLIRDINIKCDNVIEGRRSDLISVDKKAKSCIIIIDVAVPGDCRIHEKEIEKNGRSEFEERAEKALVAEKG